MSSIPARLLLTASLSLTLVCTLSAQITTASVDVGGVGAVGCQTGGPPPALNNGDFATGTLDYTYDAGTGALTIVVHNTTPIEPGHTTAVLGAIHINMPPNASATLVSQAGSGGAAPFFGYTEQPIQRGCLGTFGATVATGATGVNGCIANPAATELPTLASNLVMSPVTFVFDVASDWSEHFDADSFAYAATETAPGQFSVMAAFKFLGSSGNGSGYLGTVPADPTEVTGLGGACGSPVDPELLLGLPSVPNSSAVLSVTSPLPSARSLVYWSVGALAPVTPFPGTSCAVHLDVLRPFNVLLLADATTDANGEWSMSFAYPFTPNAGAGLTVALQGLLIAPGGPVNSDTHLTNALRIDFGAN